MAKQSGLGHGLIVAGYDISGDVTELGRIGGGPVMLEGATGIDKRAMERVPGRFDGAFEVTSWFNDATDQQHDVLSALPTVDVHAMYLCGTTAGAAACGAVAKQVNYDGAVEEDGTFKFETELQQSGGVPVEWGVLLTDNPRADGATPTTGDAVDLVVDNASGGALHVVVLAIGSGSATIALQSSSDDAATDPYVEDASVVVDAVGGRRVGIAAPTTIERYARIVTTGTFTGLQFVAMVYQRPD